jgi:tetratricopeptide (TPR) repeat protein
LPGGYNPFGPTKALVLLAGCVLLGAGLAVSPELAITASSGVARSRGRWAALALLGVAALATMMSIAPYQSLTGLYPEYQGLLLLLASAFAGFGASALADDDATWRLVGRAAVVALLVVAAYALLQFAGLDPVSYQREFVLRRVRSTLGNASNLGVFVCLALPLAIAYARASERGAWPLLAWAGVAAGALTLALSLSRGAWLGALAGTAAWLLAEGRSWDRQRRLRTAAIAAVVALVAALLLALAVPSAGSRLGSLVDASGGTARWRMEVWSATARLVAERPVLGFGPSTFRYAFPPRRTASMMAGETGTQALDDPHNLLASAAVSAGIAGLIALLWLLAEALLAAWRLGARDDRWPHAGPALLAGLAAGLTALQFHFVTLDSAPLLAVLIGLAIGRATPAPAPAPSPRARLLARSLAAATTAVCLLGVAFALSLVLADRNVATGFSLVAEKAPWAEIDGHMDSARGAASWEPAMHWALGRAATQWMSATGETDAFGDDGALSMTIARTRLPLDPLVAAQAAELYLVYGLNAKDRSALEQALAAATRACELDPENGYRWDTRGTVLAALGQTQAAVAAYQRAVRFAPADTQAWANLARMYERLGDRAAAEQARQQAARAGASAAVP